MNDQLEQQSKGSVISIGTWVGTSIYRYISIERFLEIVETEKNTLVHVSKWEDPNEVYLIREMISHESRQGDSGGVRQWYDLYRAIYGQSWMLNGAESDVLWRAYGKRGETVRISTSVNDLCKTLKKVVELDGFGYELNAYVGAISYVEDMREAMRNANKDLIRTTLFVKSKEFRDEAEFRVVMIADDGESQVDKEKAPITTSGGLLRYQVVVSDLIQSVLVDPCCSRVRFDEIMCRVMNAGFDINIERSKLFEWPSAKSMSVNAESVPVRQEASRSQETTDAFEPLETRFWKKFRAAYHGGNSEFSLLRVPDRRYWGFSIGNGLSYFVTFNSQYARAELYIDSPDKEWNKTQYDSISSALEKKHPNLFCLERLDDRRASRISIVNPKLKFTDKSQWDEAVEWLCKTLDELRDKTKDLLPEAIKLRANEHA